LTPKRPGERLVPWPDALVETYFLSFLRGLTPPGINPLINCRRNLSKIKGRILPRAQE